MGTKTNKVLKFFLEYELVQCSQTYLTYAPHFQEEIIKIASTPPLKSASFKWGKNPPKQYYGY